MVSVLAVVALAAGVSGAFLSTALWQPHITLSSGASQANANTYGIAFITVWFTLANSGQADGIATVNLVVVDSSHPRVVAQERYLVPYGEQVDFQLSAPWPFYLGPTSDLGISYPDLVSVVRA